MQDQAKKAKKNKRPLVFKPYTKGNVFDSDIESDEDYTGEVR